MSRSKEELAISIFTSSARFVPTFRDRQRRAPLVSKNIQTDAAVGIDVGVVDASGEGDLWWLEWVIGQEMDRKEEDATRVRAVALWGVSG